MHPRRVHACTNVARLARRAALLSTAAVAALLPSAGTASAAVTVHADYNAGTALATGCHKLGSSDDTGVFYTTACNNQKIIRYGRDGARLPDLDLPYKAGLFGRNYTLKTPMDLAPSPDGAHLYVTQGTTPPVRLNRTANGTYVLDATWKLEQIPAGGKLWNPIGHMITTDGRGDIYLSNGSYWISDDVPTPAFIVKYSPDGKLITAFGDVGTDVGQWNTNMDVAVSRDGRRVYVGENCGTSCKNGAANYQPSRVTRYDFTPGGQYRYARVISAQGPYNGKPYAQCEDPGAVHSAYTLALDAFENLYAGSVSCGYIQQFATDADPTKDRFVRTIVKNVTNTGAGIHNHWLSVDWAGRIYAPEWKLRFAPKTPKLPALPRPAIPALPGPDNVAPTLTAVTMPATTTTQDITVAITATDNVAVAEMRVANEDGTYGPWQPFVTPFTHRLSNGYAVKGVFVQVRDMAGNESAGVYRTTRFEAAPAPGEPPAPVANGDVAAPVIANAVAPAVTATRDITITVDATDDVAVKGIRFANEDGTWSPWRVFAAANQWTLTDGYVNKVVFVQVRDAAGNESANAVVRTRYAVDAPPANADPAAPADTVAPTLTKIALPAETTTQNVNVALTATDNVAIAQVRFANEDGNWTNWQAYATPKAWTLSPNFGGKLVFAQVRDAAGNESLTVTATTMFTKTVAGPVDRDDPTLTAVTIPETVPTRDIIVRLAAADDVGVTEVRFANEDGEWQPWKPFGNGDVPHTLTAGATVKAVFAQVRDAAGRESKTLHTRTLVQP